MPAAYAVDSDGFLEFGRTEVAAGGQGVASVETDADTRFFLDQFDDVGSWAQVWPKVVPCPAIGASRVMTPMAVARRRGSGLIYGCGKQRGFWRKSGVGLHDRPSDQLAQPEDCFLRILWNFAWPYSQFGCT